MSYSELPPAILQTSPGYFIVNKDTRLDSLQVPSGSKLRFESGKNVVIDFLTFGDDCLLDLNDTDITINLLKSGDALKIAGSGILRITDRLECGEGSKLDFSNISVVLGEAEIKFGENSELRLGLYPIKGGRLLSEGQSTIEAPCRSFFTRTELKGQWRADKSYPEWFVDNEPSDWAVSINRALELSSDGTTYLQNKTYNISSTIYVPCRGQLIGTLSGEYKGGSASSTTDKKYWGTRIVPVGNTFDAQCLIAVNISKSRLSHKDIKNFDDALDYDRREVNAGSQVTLAEENYPNPGARIANLTIVNESGINNLTGIFLAYTGQVECVIFSDLTRCICWTYSYADLKKVTRCVIHHTLKPTDSTKVNSTYAIDFSNLGDAVIFEGNVIHGIDGTTVSPNYGYKMVRLNTCLAGSLCSNIINGDVLIKNCKGITFNSNHMEYGAQIEITNSEVTLSNNYLEKGTRPNIIINSGLYANASVITLNGNLYIYLSNNGRTKIALPAGISCVLEYSKPSIEKMCDYDILIASEQNSTSAIVNLGNELRYWAKNGDISRMYPMGISVYRKVSSDKEPVVIENFKWRSHLLSRSSSLIFTPSLKASYPPMTVNSLNSPKLSILGVSDNIPWFGEKGTYSYSYQVIWDYDRKIITGNKAAGEAVISSSDKSSLNGVLINLFGAAASCGNQLTMRVIRKNITHNKTHYVDIPIVGSAVLYDDGHSLGTYKWQTRDINNDPPEVLSGGINVTSITYVGDEVITTSQS